MNENKCTPDVLFSSIKKSQYIQALMYIQVIQSQELTRGEKKKKEETGSFT
jgi:hypothetical protein